MKKLRGPATAVILVLFSQGASADLSADLRRCALILDSIERLACYDGLSKRTAAAVMAPVAAPAAAPVSAAATAPAATAAAAQGAPPPVAPAVPPAEPPPETSPAAADADSEDFGLEEQRAAETKLIRSRIDGIFDGWSGKTEFTLENGQVWRQAAGGKLVARESENPEVEIKRGFMGVYYLKVDGYNPTVKVRRIK
jgi:pyruvate/2-oxoglutarate dehydrogenase complex dihydrolipoamide acyltransferase (E2) component